MPINKAPAARVKAPPAGEEGPGLSVARNGKETTPRPSQRPHLASALAAYRDLLRGAELPDDLVAQATAADLDAARTSILDFVATASTEGGLGRWAENERHRILSRWQIIRISPQILADEYGVPFLQLAIRNRQRSDAEANLAARRAKGLTLSLDLFPSTIRGLAERKFLPADTDWEDRSELGPLPCGLSSSRSDCPSRRCRFMIITGVPRLAAPLSREDLTPSRPCA